MSYVAQSVEQRLAEIRAEAGHEDADRAWIIGVLLEHGIEMSVWGCGCCGSPRIKFAYGGRTVESECADFETTDESVLARRAEAELKFEAFCRSETTEQARERSRDREAMQEAEFSAKYPWEAEYRSRP
jgi:uncharacterized Zn finger protein (UPF0148 family)